MRPEFDERDAQIRNERAALLDRREGPRVGDWVIFADGVTRRVSHIWDLDEDAGVQTSDDGCGYYLGEGYVSYSGSLYRSVKKSTLALTDERRDGRVWFFHHDWLQAHNGVETTIPFRVFRCSETLPD